MEYNLTKTSLFFMLVLFMITMDVRAQNLAFPGAEGYGRFTSGGRGGTVYAVTNLNDSGTGSLRDAINKHGKRTIVFRVTGNIRLDRQLDIENGDLTIAGQTAPGGGIVISGEQVTLDANNVIIRFVRFRLGDSNEVEADAMSSRFGENIIIDHCTFSWGVDEVLSMYRNKNTTFQWNIVSESMNRSAHSKGDHGYGGIWGGDRASFHHNLIAHHKSRNPRMNGARYEGNWNEQVDFRNNVIYNWGENSVYGAEPSEVDGNKAKYNMVANYYKYGPATGVAGKKYRIITPDSQGSYGYSRFHITDNFVFGFEDVTADNWDGGVQGVSDEVLIEIRVDEPFEYHMESEHTAPEALEYVLRNAGVVYPFRDSVDERLAVEVATGTATYGGDSYGRGIIDSQDDVGGYPELPDGTAPDDSDGDGMPDDWETENEFDPNDGSDGAEDADGDGYTNLEEYLNELVEGTLVSNVKFLSQPQGLMLTVDKETQNFARISWLPLDPDVEVEVERALDEDGDPGAFQVVATITEDTTFQEYLDLEEDSRVYYRIKAFLDGMESFYSNVVDSYVAPSSITSTRSPATPSIFPNPAIDKLSIQSVKPLVKVTIMDISGRIFYDRKVSGKKLEVSVAEWKSGYYLMRLYTRDGNFVSKKFIKK